MRKYKNITLSGTADRILVTKEFVQKNKLHYAKTQEEIVDRVRQSNSRMLNFEAQVLIDYLDFEHAKEFLTESARKRYEKYPKRWQPVKDIYKTTQNFLDYMVFAWDKAYDERGISASRSIDKLGAWLWLMGKDDLFYIINSDELYNPYGSPALIKVCVALEIPVPDWLVEFSKHKK